jgi:hypothetical protein
MTSSEHDRAVERLRVGVAEQDRLLDRYESAIGTSTELGAYMQLRAAGDQVAACEAWVHWIDDVSYRGLNAGPFELLAESSPPEAIRPDSPRSQLAPPPTAESIQRRVGIYRSGDDVRTGRVVAPARPVADRTVGRAWLNGREVGGDDCRYTHLDDAHD